MSNLTQSYQNYRNQLSGLTNIQDQMNTIKNNIVSQHVETWDNIKDKYDKLKEIGEETAGVLGTFRLGQKFKSGITARLNQVKDKGQDLIDKAQEKVDNVVDVVKNRSDEVVNQGTDALEKVQGTMADLTGSDNVAVESAKTNIPTSSQEDFPMAPAEEMGEMTTTPGARITMGDLAKQFPAEQLEKPAVMGGGNFQIGFTGEEEPYLGGGQPEPELRGSLPTRTFVSSEAPTPDMGGSGASHSQPEVDAEEVAGDVVGDVREKTLGLFGRLRAGLFSGRAPIQQTFPTLGRSEQVMEQFKDAGGELAGEVGDTVKSGVSSLAEGVGEEVATTGAEAIAEGTGALAGLTSAIPGVGEALGLVSAITGFVGELASEGQENVARAQNPLTRSSFSQFNVIPTMSSLSSQPTTPGIF